MKEESCECCGVCCKLFLINLDKEEYYSGKYKLQLCNDDQFENFEFIEEFGLNIIKQNEDGSCYYLNNTKCSIHTYRPQVCREFFCKIGGGKFKEMIKQINNAKKERII